MGMILHCGAENVGRDALYGVHTPDATATWTPVPHHRLVEMVEGTLLAAGARIVDSTFALTKGGLRMFGVITLGGEQTDHQTVVGIRNAHDKSFKLSFCLGGRVFVCDNLAFSSEIVVATMHTRHVMRRLPDMVCDGISKLLDRRVDQERKIEAYKASYIDKQAELHDLVLRTYRAGVIPARAIAEVIEEYEAPRHEEFAPRTLWSYFNACTEVLKGYGELSKRTQRLHAVVDSEVASTMLAL